MTTALVTGGNRGIGFEVARQLGQKGLRVLLAARQPHEAEEAAKTLQREKLDVVPVPLDVADQQSIDALAERLTREGVRLHALVNNAGISLDGFNASVADRTLAVNFFGALHLTDRLRPLLEPHACVVMVSSGLGELSHMPPQMRRRFDPPPSREELIALMHSFVEDVRHGRHTAHGWPSSAYSVSKVGLNALSRIMAQEWPELRVNAVSPGWVRTRMGGSSAPRSIEQGADGIVWAATLPANGPTGGFFYDRQPKAW